MTIVLLQEAALPQSSVAVHVRVTLYSWGHWPATLTSAKVIATVASHASDTAGVPKEGVFPHSIGLTTTGQVISGAVLSSILIVWLQVLALSQSSIAVHVRVKVYD